MFQVFQLDGDFVFFARYRDNVSVFYFIRKFTFINTIFEVVTYKFAKISLISLIILERGSAFWKVFEIFNWLTTFINRLSLFF